MLRAGLLSAFFAVAACGATFTSVIAYGDSLSDNGNLFAASGIPGAPYFDGRFSNGPVAVEDLAAMLGVPLVDFAWGGATTGLGNMADGGNATALGAFHVPGMQTELQQSAAAVAPVAADALFLVWGGANDLISPSPLDTTPIAVADRAVADLLGIVNALQGLGATHILVPGLPDVGLTPEVRALGPAASAQASVLTDYFNARLSAGLPAGVMYADTAGLMRSIIANPAAFGFTNVTDACLTTSVCANPNQYLFWDSQHPTARVHTLVAAEFASEAVPEPGTAALVAIGLIAAALAPRRRRAATAA